MEIKDADKVRELDSKAFSLPEDKKRKKANIISCRNLNPEGCFIAEKDGIVGYIFSRKWGKIGWIGTFGVHPEHQGKGIGKKLLNNAKENLTQDCSLVGLSTPAKNENNIGMYIAQGFSISSPTFLLKKHLRSYSNLEKTQNKIITSEYSKDISNDLLNKISNLSGFCRDGLDYKSEVKRALKDDWDEVLYCEEDDLEWFSIVRTSSKIENEHETVDLKIRNLLFKSDDVGALLKTIRSIEAFAIERDFKNMIIPVNEVYPYLLQSLIQKMDYELHKLYIRMILRGSYTNSKGTDLNIWIM